MSFCGKGPLKSSSISKCGSPGMGSRHRMTFGNREGTGDRSGSGGSGIGNEFIEEEPPALPGPGFAAFFAMGCGPGEQ